MKPKVSVITVCLNSEDTIKESLASLSSQDYELIEYIVIDGDSSDRTRDILNDHMNLIDILVSEKDKGLYDALNKGINLASGDIIGILHSDDEFAHNGVLSNIVSIMRETNADVCFSDMTIEDLRSGKVLRYYSSKYFNRFILKTGWMPAHPATFIRKSIFDKYGLYSLDYKIAADFDFFLRIFKSKEIKWIYLNDLTVKMKTGGASNSGVRSKFLIAKEIRKALQFNGYKSLFFLQAIRYLIRISEYFIKPRSKK